MPRVPVVTASAVLSCAIHPHLLVCLDGDVPVVGVVPCVVPITSVPAVVSLVFAVVPNVHVHCCGGHDDESHDPPDQLCPQPWISFSFGIYIEAKGSIVHQ